MPLLTNKVVWQTHFVAADATDSPCQSIHADERPLDFGTIVCVCVYVHVYVHAKSHYPTPFFPLAIALTLRIRRISR